MRRAVVQQRFTYYLLVSSELSNYGTGLDSSLGFLHALRSITRRRGIARGREEAKQKAFVCIPSQQSTGRVIGARLVTVM